MLKKGVQMVEALPNPDESDINSDWKGFWREKDEMKMLKCRRI